MRSLFLIAGALAAAACTAVARAGCESGFATAVWLFRALPEPGLDWRMRPRCRSGQTRDGIGHRFGRMGWPPVRRVRTCTT
jgi:hypothetical protein